jgi:predicted nucleotidyltransferase
MVKFGRRVTIDIDARQRGVVELLAHDTHVAAIWLFGSHASDAADILSDVDLAVIAR